MLGLDLLESLSRLVRGLALVAFSLFTLVFIPFRLARSAGRGVNNWYDRRRFLPDDTNPLVEEHRASEQSEHDLESAPIEQPELTEDNYPELLQSVLETDMSASLSGDALAKDLYISDTTQRARDEFCAAASTYADQLTLAIEHFTRLYQGEDRDNIRQQLIEKTVGLARLAAENYGVVSGDENLRNKLVAAALALVHIGAPANTRISLTDGYNLCHVVITAGNLEQLQTLFANGIDPATRKAALIIAAKNQQPEMLSQLLRLKNTKQQSPSAHHITQMCDTWQLLEHAINASENPITLEKLKVLVEAGALIDNKAQATLRSKFHRRSQSEQTEAVAYMDAHSTKTLLQASLKADPIDEKQLERLEPHVSDKEKQAIATTLILNGQSDRALRIYPPNQLKAEDLKRVVNESIRLKKPSILDDFIQHYQPTPAICHDMLCLACQITADGTHDFDIAKHLIEQYDSPLQKDDQHYTLLRYLVEKPGNLAFIQYLCQQGADIGETLSYVPKDDAPDFIEYVRFFYNDYPQAFTPFLLEYIADKDFYVAVARSILQNSDMPQKNAKQTLAALHPYSQMRQMLKQLKEQANFDPNPIQALLEKFPAYFHDTEKGRELLDKLVEAKPRSGEETAQAIKQMIERFKGTASADDVSHEVEMTPEQSKAPVGAATLFHQKPGEGEHEQQTPDNGPKPKK